MIARMIVLALALNVLSAVVWVGGMFAAYVCLRPAAGRLEAPHRLRLWHGFFERFFSWVWASWVLLVLTGYWMLSAHFGGFRRAPAYVNVMQALGWLMVLLYGWLFHGPFRKFRRAVAAEEWPVAAANLGRIRQIIMINLPIGLIVVIVGGTGRYWGF